MMQIEIERLRTLAKRPDLDIEFRKGYGWFIVERGQTLMGFHRKNLLLTYIENAVTRGYLYAPTKRETYGGR